MKQINNGFAACYYLTEKGQVYNEQTKRYLNADNSHRFQLKTEEGNYKKIHLKPLYQLVFNKNYCIDTIENLPGEEWKPIANTKELYFISNMGRCKSLQGYEAIILKENYVKGYARVDIVEESGRSSKLISRLVAAAFLLPPKSIDCQLHHKNGKQDNRAEALEWLTPQEHRELHRKLKNEKEQDK